MKNTLGLFFLVQVFAGLFICSGCKKGSPPSIIGTWTMSNVTSNYSSQTITGNDTASSTDTIAYSAPVESVIQKTTHSPGATTTINLNGYALIIEISSNGTYLTTEKYIYQNTSVKTNTAGEWTYLSNNNSNDNITFDHNGSILLNGVSFGGDTTFGLNRSFFTINSLTANQLILSGSNSSTSYNNTGSVQQSSNAMVTFTR